MIQFYNYIYIIEWLNMTKLNILGFNEKHVYFIMFFVCLLLIYLTIQPIMSWIIALQTPKLLSYLFSSLFVVIAFFLLILFVEVIDLTYMKILGTFKIVLQALAAFGLCLILFYTMQRLLKTRQ